MSHPVTVIRNAAWVVAWDDAASQHVYRREADVAFSADGILHVGGRFEGRADVELSGASTMVLPGLVNIHCHSGDEPIAKGLFEDQGTPALWGNALYEFSALVDADEDAKAACQTVMLGDLMRSGVTTHLDIASPHAQWVSLAAQSGLRAYLAAGFREAAWRLAGRHRLDYAWDEARGRERYAQALAFVDEARRHPSGRIEGIIAPSQIDTCSEALIQDAVAAARSRGLRITIHAAQTMAEHEELVRRTGETAPQMLERLGVLGPDLILGHCIFLDHHSWTRQRSRDDLDRLARSRTSVAHCPVTFARSGMTLESLGAYRRAGVNVGIGTDSYPFNMLEEMREALICSRIAGRSVFDLDTADLLDAATVGGATALGRDDLGRLREGAAADLVLVDLDHPAMQPVHDPLRNLIHCAAERAVSAVYVEGRAVVQDGRVLHLDYDGAVRELQAIQRRACAEAERSDSQGRTLAAPGSILDEALVTSRIYVINPNSSAAVTAEIDRAVAPLRSADGPAIECLSLPEGPPGIQSQRDVDGVIAPMLRKAAELEAEAGAFVVACFSDPGLHALREQSRRRVFGIAECGVLSALTLGQRFGVIAILPTSIPRHLRYFGAMGVTQRLAADLPIGLGVAELSDDNRALSRMIEVGTTLRTAHGADVLVMGCAGMARFRASLEDAVGLPVVEPTQAAVAMAVGHVRLSRTA